MDEALSFIVGDITRLHAELYQETFSRISGSTILVEQGLEKLVDRGNLFIDLNSLGINGIHKHYELIVTIMLLVKKPTCLGDLEIIMQV